MRANDTTVTVVAVVAGLILGLVISAALFRTPTARQPPTSHAAAAAADAADPAGAAGARPDSAPPPAGNTPARAAVDLSGSWLVTNEVESTAYRAFRGLRMEYELELAHEGDAIRGKGFKRSENGKPLPRSRRTPITVEGTRVADRLQLRFTESGARRQSSGTFDLAIVDARTLRGSFASDAAKSQGSSVAAREERRPQ